MRKIKLLFVFIICYSFISAQQIFPIKETYDQIIEPNYSSVDYNSSSIAWWQGWGWTLISYLKMYETTQDKSYLNKFIKYSYGLQMRRDSEIWNSVMNNNDPTIVLYTGQLLRPMAEFVYLVKHDLNLTNTNILSGLIPNSISNPTQSINNYGDYASWLKMRITQSIDYINLNYWINDHSCYSKTKLSICERNCANNNCAGIGCIFCDCPEAIEINFNSSYASTMFFIGQIDPINYSDYTNKAEQIVDYFKDRITEYLPNHSYTWFHTNDPDCFSIAVKCREDISHGGTDIQIPIIAYQLYGDGLFSSSEMSKFAATFTNNIWDNVNQEFHNNVFGTNDEITPPNGTICGGNLTINGTANIYGPGEVLTWMPLYIFDLSNSPDNIYNILLNHTIKLITNDPLAHLPLNYCNSGNTVFLSGSQSLYGLTEVIKAQWQKECVNLKLYNRRVVYDQDFTVKNSLTIQPNLSDDIYTVGQSSFADPIISTPEFSILSGVTSHIIAGEEIALLDGFSAVEGSNVSMTINPNACSDGNRYAVNNDTSTSTQAKNKSTKQVVNQNKHINSLTKQTSTQVTSLTNTIEETSFAMYPNPAQTTLTLLSPNKVSIVIIDMMGNIVMRKQSTSSTTELGIQELPNGIYYVQAYTDNDSFVQKFLKE